MAAVVRTASIVDEGIRAGVWLSETIFEAAGSFAQGASWDLGLVFREVCDAAMLAVRVAAAVQCCYVVYYHCSWLGQLLRLGREPTAGEAAQRGLTASARACVAGDGPGAATGPLARAAAASRGPERAVATPSAASPSDYPSPAVALWQETPFGTPAGPRPQVIEMQRSAATALRDLADSDRQRAGRGRDLAACGAVV